MVQWKGESKIKGHDQNGQAGVCVMVWCKGGKAHEGWDLIFEVLSQLQLRLLVSGFQSQSSQIITDTKCTYSEKKDYGGFESTGFKLLVLVKWLSSNKEVGGGGGGGRIVKIIFA